MVEDAQKVLAQARDQVRALQDKATGQASMSEESDMIHIGDQVNVQPAAAAARALSPWLVAGLLAASGLGGAGLVAALLPKVLPAALPAAQPQEFKVDFWIDEGKVKTQVEPLPIPLK